MNAQVNKIIVSANTEQEFDEYLSTKPSRSCRPRAIYWKPEEKLPDQEPRIFPTCLTRRSGTPVLAPTEKEPEPAEYAPTKQDSSESTDSTFVDSALEKKQQTSDSSSTAETTDDPPPPQNDA